MSSTDNPHLDHRDVALLSSEIEVHQFLACEINIIMTDIIKLYYSNSNIKIFTQYLHKVNRGLILSYFSEIIILREERIYYFVDNAFLI